MVLKTGSELMPDVHLEHICKKTLPRSRDPACVGAGSALGMDSGPVQKYNGGDTYSWHFMPLKNYYRSISITCFH